MTTITKSGKPTMKKTAPRVPFTQPDWGKQQGGRSDNSAKKNIGVLEAKKVLEPGTGKKTLDKSDSRERIAEAMRQSERKQAENSAYVQNQKKQAAAKAAANAKKRG